MLLFCRLRYDTPDNAIGYAMHSSRSHNAVIRVYDAAGNVIETHKHKGDFTLVFVDCQFGLKEGKMKGSTKPERMDEPFSFKPEDRSHRSCVHHELGGNAKRCQSSGGANH